MPHYPLFDQFAELARTHTVVPVYRRLTSDTLTPVSAFKKIEAGEWSFLFESVVGGERIGRYSFLGSEPFRKFEARGNAIRTQEGSGPWIESTANDPLSVLEKMIDEYRAPNLADLPRFCGGAVGYAGYDTVRYVERLEHPPQDDRKLPDLSFALYDRTVIFDHLNKTIAAVAHAHVPGVRDQESGVKPLPGVRDQESGVKPQDERSDSWGSESQLKESYDAACRRVDELVEKLRKQDAS